MEPIDITTAEHYPWGNGCDGWHLLKHDDLSVIQERVPPGEAEAKHLHHHSRQFFYILSGQATLTVGNRTFLLRPAQGIEIPPGVPHQFRNDSQEEVTFIVVSAPKSHGDRQNLSEPA